jgi:hypothetical protein
MRSAIIKRGSKTWETRSECINFGHEAAVGREKSNSGGRKNRIIHMQLAPEARRELAALWLPWRGMQLGFQCMAKRRKTETLSLKFGTQLSCLK